jgi:hypothetical protein
MPGKVWPQSGLVLYFLMYIVVTKTNKSVEIEIGKSRKE